MHRTVTEATGLGHQARTPVRGLRGPCLQSLRDQPFDITILHGAWSARPRRIHQAIEPVRHKALAPFADGLRRNLHRPSDGRIRLARATGQNDPGALGERLRGGPTTGLLGQDLMFVSGQHDGCCRASRSHSILLR